MARNQKLNFMNLNYQEYIILKNIEEKVLTTAEIYAIFYDVFSYDKDLSFRKSKEKVGHFLYEFYKQKYIYRKGSIKGDARLSIYFLTDKGETYLKLLKENLNFNKSSTIIKMV